MIRTLVKVVEVVTAINHVYLDHDLKKESKSRALIELIAISLFTNQVIYAYLVKTMSFKNMISYAFFFLSF